MRLSQFSCILNLNMQQQNKISYTNIDCNHAKTTTFACHPYLPKAKTETRSAATYCNFPKAAFKPVIPPLRQAVPFYVLPFGPPSLRDALLALRLLRVTPPSEAATLRDSTFGDGQAIDMLN